MSRVVDTAPRPGSVDDIVAAARALSVSNDRWRVDFARRHGLADNDSFVMSHLLAAGGALRPREISTAMGVTTGTLTPRLDRLVACGFVRRTPNPADRRSVLVEITDAGRQALADVHRALRNHIERTIPQRAREDVAAALWALASLADDITGGEVA